MCNLRPTNWTLEAPTVIPGLSHRTAVLNAALVV